MSPNREAMTECRLELLHEPRDFDPTENELGHDVESARLCAELVVLEVAGIGVMIVATRTPESWPRLIRSRNESGSRQDMRQ